MRKQGFGKIFAVSSIAGEIGIPFQAFYSELYPFGIDSALIMLGYDIYKGKISKSA